MYTIGHGRVSRPQSFVASAAAQKRFEEGRNGHRAQFVTALILLTALLFVRTPRARADELSDLKETVKQLTAISASGRPFLVMNSMFAVILGPKLRALGLEESYAIVLCHHGGKEQRHYCLSGSREYARDGVLPKRPRAAGPYPERASPS